MMTHPLFNIMKTNVRRWGNSIGIRIPKILAKEVGMVDGTAVEMNVVNHQIIISKPKLSLDDLLGMVTPSNTHGETDTGSVKGKEKW